MAIIQPFQKKKVTGPPVARIVIEVDAVGQANVDCRNLHMPMTPLSSLFVAKVLSSVLGVFLDLMMQGKNAGQEPIANEGAPENPPTSPTAG